VGCGEASTALAWPKETPKRMQSFARHFKKKLVGCTLHEAFGLVLKTWKRAGNHCAILNAFECALWDLKAQEHKKSLFQLLGGKKKALQTSFTISAWPAPLAFQVARNAWRQGFKILKIKTGSGDIFEDLKRVIAVSNAAPHAKLMLDANQGWSLEDAQLFIQNCKTLKLPILLIEQPLDRKALQEAKQLKKLSPYPIFADESIKNIQDAKCLIQYKAVDGFNLKLAKHGLTQALKIIELAKRAKLKLMLGCMSESVLGQSASVHLACGTGSFTWLDLDSHLLLKPQRRLKGGFKTRAAQLMVSRVLGSGSRYK
jgi:L-alanine-DL-glutamate epimerase-like enolase superfamily enzyme